MKNLFFLYRFTNNKWIKIYKKVKYTLENAFCSSYKLDHRPIIKRYTYIKNQTQPILSGTCRHKAPYNLAFSPSVFQWVTNCHHLGRSNVDDVCHSIDCKCLYTWPSLIPNGEFKTKSFGAIVSINGMASSFKTGNNSIIPAFKSSIDRGDVMKPPFLEQKKNDNALKICFAHFKRRFWHISLNWTVFGSRLRYCRSSIKSIFTS